MEKPKECSGCSDPRISHIFAIDDDVNDKDIGLEILFPQDYTPNNMKNICHLICYSQWEMNFYEIK